MSTSRAKKKRRQRARPPAAPAAVEGRGAAAAKRGRAERSGAAAAGARATGGDGAQGGPRAQGGDRPSRLEVRDGVVRPDAIWAPFPLTEVGMLAGLVIFGVGFASKSFWLLSIGAVVLIAATGELCLREHLTGFRSHTLLLAALPVAIVHAVVVLAITDSYRGPVSLVVDLALGGALAWWLRGRYDVAHERNRAP